jgi:cobalt-zinc-cadmium efflux system outer membrane protein
MLRLVMALFLLLSMQPAFAGFSLTLQEAETLFLSNNIGVKARKADLKKSEAEVIDARLLPNPDLRYYGEAITPRASGADQLFSVSQPLDIAGKRMKRLEVAQKRKDAQSLSVDYDIGVLLLQMKQSYYRILLLKEQAKVMENIVEMSKQVEDKIAERVAAGDAAEVERMKLAAEKSKFLRTLEGLRAESKVERKRLALMLDLEEADFETAGRLEYRELPAIAAVSAEVAVDGRPDVRAQTTLVEAASALVTLSRREALPQASVEGGYKWWAEGLGGPVFGVSVSLPLFSRNQGKIAAARAETERQRFNYELARKTAVKEIEIQKERISFLQGRIADITQQMEATREITNIARIAYEEGEAGLIEMLDAVRAERELALEHNNTLYEYWAAVFELERATHTRLSGDGGAR